MKYMVMECHKAYAVLMDEESRFIHAANLGYTVGDTVTDPVLMDEEPKNFIARSILVRTAAIAAGLVLMSASVFGYYVKNMKTESVMTIGSEAAIEIEINSKGKVIGLHSNSELGQEILKKYSGKNKDSAAAAEEILKLQIEQGYISDGDTVDLFISTDNAEAYDSVKEGLEHGLADLNVNINVKDHDVLPPKKEPAAPPAPPVPPEDKPVKDDKDKPVPSAPPAPAVDDKKPDTPPTPSAPHENDDDKNKPDKPAKEPGKDEKDKPVPPAPPAPAEGEKPGSGDNKPAVEPPAPPAPPEGDVPPEVPDAPKPPEAGIAEPPAIRPHGVDKHEPFREEKEEVPPPAPASEIPDAPEAPMLP